MNHTYLTSLQVAQRLGISTRTLQRVVRRGALVPACYTPGGHPRFRPADVEVYAARRETTELYPTLMAPDAVEGEYAASFRYLAELSPDGVLLADRSHRVRLANPALTALLGYEAQEMHGRAVVTFVDAADQAMVRARLACGRQGAHAVERIEAFLRRHDGAVVWAMLTIMPLFAATGAYGGAWMLVADRTAHRRLEEAVRTSERRYRALEEYSAEIVSIVDGQNVLRYVSPSYYAVLGYVPERLVGTLALDLMHPDDAVAVARRMAARAQGARGGDLSVPHAARFRHADGSWRWLESTVIDARSDPELAGFVIRSRDVTARHEAEEALRASEAAYRRLIETAHEGIWQLDAAGCTTAVNPRLAELLGYPPADLLGRPLADFVPPADQGAAQARVARWRQGVPDEEEVCYRRRDGSLLWARTRAEPLSDVAGCCTGVLVQLEDITARKQMEEMRAHLVSIVDSSTDAILSVALDGTITSWNAGATQLYGYTAVEVIGRPITLLSPPERAHEVARVGAVIRRGERLSDVDSVSRRKDGSLLPVSYSVAPIHDATGTIVGAACIFRDRTERQRAEDALRHQALHDALTGLPNRALLDDRLRQALAVADRGGTPVALLLLDLDRFKEVNDTFGHAQGNVALREVATRLQRLLRATDTVARLGGDEFAVVLPGDDAAAALRTVGRIQQALEAPIALEPLAVPLGASIGVALYPAHGPDPETLLRRADVAMYTAKRSGAVSALYSAEHDIYTPERLVLIEELRAAIRTGRLQLYYQPQAATADGTVIGVEALVRWPHPVRGLIAPDAFLPLAEQTGQMAALTRWVLEEAIRQAQQLAHRGGPAVPVAVNIAAPNLRDPELPALIGQLLCTYDVAPARLRLEVTEGTLMADAEQACAILGRLAAMGLGVSVDDYGTGYSNLAYLKRLAIDELKIDRTFVREMTHDATDAAIVASTVTLGHSLGLCVVAEGVEDAATWEALRELGCDIVQGYGLARPLPAAQLERWLRRRRAGARLLRAM